jgi:TolB-like protein/class 3 adenylate cyclase/Flp pilus assembly protein TadD
MPQSRQLAAIMFTDIVGYTALMGHDEQNAVAILNKNRELQKPIINQFTGRWIKELGDGILASFNSVSDAVNAAIKIQEACQAANDFQLRIGIHLGEVLFENEDVFGDGVNIASRIQTFARPGSIFISESVYNNISNKKDISTKFIKEEALRNVKEPVRMFEVVTTTDHQLPLEFTMKNRPQNSIAVLPFANMSSDPEQEYFSDGISEEIINMLTQVQGLKVAGRTSSFSFKGKNQDLRSIGEQLNVNHILEGSVRKSGDKLRITAQLIKVTDGYHLYSEKFDRKLDDIFDIQDEIALAILNAIKIKLFENEEETVLKRYTNNTEAYQLFLKGRYYYRKWSGSDRYKKSIECFNEAIKIESRYALAYTGLAGCYLSLWFFSYASPEECLIKMKEATWKSLALDDTISETHVSLARMYWWYEWNAREAEKEFMRAIKLNPNDTDAHEQLGIMLSITGRRNEALAEGQKAIALEPFSPSINTGLGWIYWILGDAALASKQGEQLIEMDPDYFGGHFMLGLSWISMGKYEEASSELKIAADQNPGSFTLFHLGFLSGLLGKHQEARNVLDELLRMRINEPVANFHLAMIYASIGEKDLAIQYLEKGVEEREGMMVASRQYCQLIPGFKSDSRLNILYEKIGLPISP